MQTQIFIPIVTRSKFLYRSIFQIFTRSTTYVRFVWRSKKFIHRLSKLCQNYLNRGSKYICDEALAINVTFACKWKIFARTAMTPSCGKTPGHYTLSLRSTFLTFIDDAPGDIHGDLPGNEMVYHGGEHLTWRVPLKSL